jgi:hypothetical protein
LKENNSRFEKRLQEVLSKLKDEGKTKWVSKKLHT